MTELVKNEIDPKIEPQKDLSVLKSTLLLLGSWIFAYLFGILIHECGHAIAFALSGYDGIRIYLHLFDISYTGITFSGWVYFPTIFIELNGSLFNIFCATLISVILWPKRNQFLLPILLWIPAAFIPESVAIFDDLSADWGDWGIAVQLGFPYELALTLGILFTMIGFISALFILPLAYDISTTALWKRLLINLAAFPIWYLGRVVYCLITGNNFLLSSGLIALGASAGSAILITFIQKPLYSFLNKISHVVHKKIKWSTIGLALILAIIMILVFTLRPYVPVE